uniref:MucBP domain-containing protein n=1 Tax=Syphacia muris TaxID=451379 RepID=A0A0N5AAT3_9BILA
MLAANSYRQQPAYGWITYQAYDNRFYQSPTYYITFPTYAYNQQTTFGSPIPTANIATTATTTANGIDYNLLTRVMKGKNHHVESVQLKPFKDYATNFSTRNKNEPNGKQNQKGNKFATGYQTLQKQYLSSDNLLTKNDELQPDILATVDKTENGRYINLGSTDAYTLLPVIEIPGNTATIHVHSIKKLPNTQILENVNIVIDDDVTPPTVGRLYFDGHKLQRLKTYNEKI